MYNLVNIVQCHANFCLVESSLQGSRTQIRSTTKTLNLFIIHNMYWIINYVSVHLRLLSDVWWSRNVARDKARWCYGVTIGLQRLRILWFVAE